MSQAPKRGAPFSGPEPLNVSKTIRISKSQDAKLEKLGGGVWVREQIDRAKVKP